MVPKGGSQTISALHGTCQKCNFPGLTRHISNQKVWGWSLAICVLTHPLGDSDTHPSLRNNDLSKHLTWQKYHQNFGDFRMISSSYSNCCPITHKTLNELFVYLSPQLDSKSLEGGAMSYLYYGHSTQHSIFYTAMINVFNANLSVNFLKTLNMFLLS